MGRCSSRLLWMMGVGEVGRTVEVVGLLWLPAITGCLSRRFLNCNTMLWNLS